MAIALSGVTLANSGTTLQAANVPIVIDLPAGAAAGHVAELWLETAAGAATVTGPNSPSVWDEHANGDSGGGTVKVGLWERVLNAADIAAGSVSVVRTGSTSYSAILTTWSGAAPDAVSAVQNGGTATTTPTIPAVTPVAANCRRLGFVACRVSTSNLAASATPPSGGSWVEHAETIDTNATLQRRLTFVDSIQLTGQAGVPQATTTATTTQSVTYAAYSLTLAPAGTTVSGTAAAAFGFTATGTGRQVRHGTAAAALKFTAGATAAAAIPPPPGTVVGVGTPRVKVQVAPSGSSAADPDAGAFIVGRNRVGDPVSSLSWIRLDGFGDGVLSVDVEPGQSGRFDSPGPARCTIVAENYSGIWDPMNPERPFGVELRMPIRVRVELTTGGTNALYPAPNLFPSPNLFPAGAATAGSTVDYDQFTGFVEDILNDYGMIPTVTFVCSDILADLGGEKLPATSAVGGGETTGVRLARVLADAGVPPSLTQLDDGVAHCIPAVYGQPALTLVQEIVNTEFGELWVDGAGKVIFYERTKVYAAARSLTVQATFADIGGATVPIEGLGGARRLSDIYNRVTVTREGQPDVTAQDLSPLPGSQQPSLPRDFPEQVGQLLPTTIEATSLTRFILAVVKKPKTRFGEIVVDAVGLNQWETLLPLRRFDRIRAIRTYAPGLSVDVELLIESIGIHITAVPFEWRLTIGTRDVDTYRPFVVGFSRVGDTI